ncbi:MAG TPA: type II secretion system F family protein [Fimbriiglobus sp.]
MILPTRRPLPALLLWCRTIKHGLYVGLPLPKVFRQQAKSGPPQLRDTARKIAELLDDGESLASAMNANRDRFPPLMLELIKVGEQGGRLTEIFGELEQYFETVIDARKTFLRALIWPGITYVMAVITLAALVFVLGMIAPMGVKADPLGLGLSGPGGAIVVLIGGAAVAGFGFALYHVLNESDAIKAAIEGFVLPIPWLGGCIRAFALHRFSLGFQITSEAGMRADKALKQSLKAATNLAYAKNADRAAKMAKDGKPISDIVAACGAHLFPPDFVEIVRMGEETGQLPEVMKKQAEQLAKEAAWKAKLFAQIAGMAVYFLIGCFVMVAAYRVFNTSVAPAYNDAFKAVDDPEKWLRGN